MSSSLSYNPDPGALPSGATFLQLLTQRDLGLQIPLNYVTAPGVSLTSACFSHNVYEHSAAAKCFSNLLAMGFKRIEIDVYWDVTQESWSLCPVQLGDPTAGPSTQSSSTTEPVLTSSVSLGTGDTSGDLQQRQTTIGIDEIDRRQVLTSTTELLSSTTSRSVISSVTSYVTPNPSVASAETPASTTGNPGSSSLMSSSNTTQIIGPYSCTESTNLDLFMSVLSENLGDTQRDLNASMKYIVFNLHAASSAANPLEPAYQPASNTLPQGSNLLSQILLGKMSAYLYTPSQLQTQRADLNASGSPSWSAVPGYEKPNTAYFQLDPAISGTAGDLSTPNGWPGEGFVEQSNYKRLLSAFGQVDPQMAGYNFTADEGDIFPQGYIIRDDQVTYDIDGSLTGGCFYQASIRMLDASTNSSWAVYGLNMTSPIETVYTLASNLTSCGISPILNQTLSNTTADQSYKPYEAFVNSTLWVWQPGQPRNTSNDNDGEGRRCAAMNSTNFRLQQEDCSDEHYAACRIGGLPYTWQISSAQVSYMNADQGCGDNTSFSVPRNALESTYLGHTWQAYQSPHMDNEDTPDELLWVDFNDLDVASCWVIGQNSTCPYVDAPAAGAQRIVVPVVAAIIVFVLTFLTIFVKCAGNRRMSKAKRRRGTDGWDYEGVPS